GEVFLLPFPDGSVEALEAEQLVEHLGYVGTLYAFHEWARVLVAGGTLHLETPHRDATLRAALDEEVADSTLPWLFGMEQRGLAHRYLFSEEELAELAGRAGFEDLQVRTVLHRTTRPRIQITARRSPNTPEGRFKSRLHRAFVLTGWVKPTDTPQYLAELEAICERAATLIRTPSSQALVQLFSLSARYGPRVAAYVLGALPASPRWPSEELSQATRLVAELEREQFPARLACRWRTIPKLSGTEDGAWALLEREITLYLTARLYPGAGLDDVRAAFEALRPTPSDQSIHFFSRRSLDDLARRVTAQGVRAFARDDYETAREAFEAATGYAPAQTWPRWNLARLYLREERLLDALEQYEALQAGLPPDLRQAYERELDAITGRAGCAESFAVPLSDVSDLRNTAV
ncbi:MAG: hypothetical protein PVH41_04590, partial [Anaerolineae bacterium]